MLAEIEEVGHPLLVLSRVGGLPTDQLLELVERPAARDGYRRGLRFGLRFRLWLWLGLGLRFRFRFRFRLGC